MSHSSPFSLHRIAAATVFNHPAFAAAMSTRPPFRGGRSVRGRRSYSDSPNIVSDANSAVQRPTATSSNHRNNNNNNNNSSYNSQRYSNNTNQNNQNYSHISRGRGGGGNFGPRAAAPPFKRGTAQPVAQRSKPADFRTWEYAKHPPPPNCERFVVLSYNILADYLATGHRNLYYHIPHWIMSWEWRKRNILFELKLWSPDIMCFQEVDKFQELEEDLRIHGYSGIWKMRTGEPVDGCAIFFRTTRFKLVFEDCIEFNKHGMRDNVAQICVLESLIQNQQDDQLSSSSSGGPNRVVVCNIHVLYNPRRGEMKLGQVRMLFERAQAVSKTWDDAPVVLCGDFNCVPKSPLYNFISQQKLDISQVDRDKVSGQASAVIHPPPRLYGYQSREPAGYMANPMMARNKVFGKDSRDNCNLNISQSINTCSSSSESVEVSVVGRTTDLPPQTVGDLNTSTALNSDETNEKRPLNKIADSLKDDTNLGEDTKEFLSALQSGEDVSTSNLEEVVLKADIAIVDKRHKPFYNPSMWTAMEIATATGGTESTVLEHPLKLSSTYSEVVDSSGTRDSCGEPLVTSYNSCFMGTVDYIWRSDGLQTVKVLAPIPTDAMQPSRGFPTKKWGSDHIALASELVFTK